MWEGSEEFPELLFQMGLLYLWPRGTTVSEEILYNVIVGEGHLCPGSLLHALVSSRKRCHLSFRKHFTQNSNIVWRDYFFKKSSRNNQNDFLKNTWIEHMWRKIPTDRKTQQSALWIRARVNLCREITGIHTYMQTSWVFKYNPISFAWKYWLKQNPSKHLKD